MNALRDQMARNGYVYLPGYLGRERVVEGRRAFIETLRQAGALHPAHDPMEGVLAPDAKPGFTGGRLEVLFDDWRALHRVLYEGPMITFFERFFGEAVKHYDFTWTRQVGRGPSTDIHADVVYMGRGTHELFTAWTPWGDNSTQLGGLILLEGSNNHAGLAKSYFQQDVDAYCQNKPDARAWGKSWGTGGWLHGDANQIRRSLGGGRWLTGDYRMGDVVLFSVYTIHGGTDNRTDRIRLSTDTRYQRASAPADDRWIGASPVAHGPDGKRGKIC